MMHRLFPVLWLSLGPAIASALPVPCMRSNMQIQTHNLIQSVAVIDDPDRKTFEEYARDHGESLSTIQQRYAASGDLSCNGGKHFGQAQLVVRGDIIVTASHVIFDSSTCKQMVNPLSNCSLVITSKRGQQTIPVSQMISSGAKCPEAKSIDQTEDWAVLKLAHPVDSSVQPYRVGDGFGMFEGQPVVTVARASDFTQRDKKGHVVSYPKYIGECTLKTIWKSAGNSIFMGANCDGATGASGGALLNGNQDNPMLLGIEVVGPETDRQAHEAGRAGHFNAGPYDPVNWGTGFVPVAGKLLNTLQGLDQSGGSGANEQNRGIEL